MLGRAFLVDSSYEVGVLVLSLSTKLDEPPGPLGVHLAQLFSLMQGQRLRSSWGKFAIW